jgi:NAD(P)-dependent dehydrogenase (short-subunit alcohol dehydrogenase family)
MNVVVTGSSSGIGRALVERLLSRGHHVWGLARSDPAAFPFRSSRCDVGDYAQVARAAADVAAEWKHVDALVTCAAIHGEVGRALSADPAKWSATLRANLDGTFHSLRAFDALLARTSRRAKVVCFSGGGATQARPNFSAYGVAKTGVVRLVETIAREEGARALDINAVAPGAIDTRLTDEIIRFGPAVVGENEVAAAEKAKAAGDAPLANALDLVEWLLSPASDGLSGRLLSAVWDSWRTLEARKETLRSTDGYTLRRVTPEDRSR